MIASIFGKSKPINIIIVAAFLVLVILVNNFHVFNQELNAILRNLSNLILILFSLFLLDFINSKNNLTQKNSYAILWFGLLVALFPKFLDQTSLIWSNLFVMLAFRRLVSLHSKKDTKKKLFDASFWIMIATFFNPWAFLFFGLVIIAVIYYSGNDVKTIVIPVIGILTALVFKVCYNIIRFDNYVLESDIDFGPTLDIEFFQDSLLLVKITMFLLIFLWSFSKLVIALGDKSTQLKPAFVLLLWAGIIGIVAGLLSNPENGIGLIYAIGPSAIIIALNTESFKKTWIRDGLIAFMFVVPIVFIFL